MTQPNLIELAKQGNIGALDSLVNYLLQDKGITASVAFKDVCLIVLLKSAQVPEQQSSVEFICKLMQKLEIKTIKSVQVCGKQIGQDSIAWTEFVDLTRKVKNPKEQTRSLQLPKPVNQSAIATLWPAWFPYPSSWLRSLILVPIAFPGAILIVFGFGGILLSTIQNNPLSLIAFTLVGLLLPTIFLSFIYHLLWFKWNKPAWLTLYFKCWQNSNSWWEGLYATFVIGLSFLAVTTIFTVIFYSTCSSGDKTVEEVYGCSGHELASALRTTFNKIKNIWDVRGREAVISQKDEFTANLWCGIWLTFAAYFYQAEYLIRKHFTFKQLTISLLSTVLSFWVAQVTYLVYSTSKNPKTPVATASQSSQPVPSASATVTPSATPSPVSEASVSPLLQPDSFRDAVNKAMSAAQLAQGAKSQAEWKAVASYWQEAIALMKAVPVSSPNYTIARKKVVEYQRNAGYALSAASQAK